MTYIDLNKPEGDDGFVNVPQPALESYAPLDPSFQSPPTYTIPTQQPAKKSKIWVVILVIALVLLCCCCLIGGLVYYFFYYLGYTLKDFTLISPLLTLL